jgi:hypothetical protein
MELAKHSQDELERALLVDVSYSFAGSQANYGASIDGFVRTLERPCSQKELVR